MAARREQSDGESAVPRFPHELLYRAAQLYYSEDATQAEIAEALGTSRPTVSRLLAEARAVGIVRIEVREPDTTGTTELADDLARVIGLSRAWVSPGSASTALGRSLAPVLTEALLAANLRSGDGLLVSSGITVHEASREELPRLPGVLLAPTVGGRDEPEEHYQTNEITRRIAVKVAGTAVLLHAPAMPGSALHEQLMRDESILRVTRLWLTARAAILGVGAPPTNRVSTPSGLYQDGDDGLAGAVGDICQQPYDSAGVPLPFPGQERLVAMGLDDLHRIPHAIGVAVGAAKVEGILVAARAGYINELVTDSPTARLLVEAAQAVSVSRSA